MALPLVLLVGDEAIVVRDLMRRLMRWGYAVTRAVSGAEAAAIWALLRPIALAFSASSPRSALS